MAHPAQENGHGVGGIEIIVDDQNAAGFRGGHARIFNAPWRAPCTAYRFKTIFFHSRN
jgi:hypothetical protein